MRIYFPHLLIFAFLTSYARSAVIVTITESAAGVEVDGTGSFDFFGSSIGEGFGTSGLFSTNENIGFGDPLQNPSAGNMVTGPSYLLPNFLGPSSFGFSSDFPSDINTSDGFVFSALGFLILPDSYVPGSNLNSSAVILGESILSIGLAPGNSVWSWSDGVGNSDSFTLSVIPEPQPAYFFTVCIALLVSMRKRAFSD